MALDASIGIGQEGTYGQPATAIEGYEGKADSWKTTREFIESVGFRAGMQTARADRRNIVNMGGEGELEVDLLDAGAASLIASCFDEYDGGSDDGLGVRTHVFATSSNSAAPSFTAQMIRPTVEGTHVAYKHVGCVATEFSLTAEVEEPVVFNVTFDFQDVTHSTNPAEHLPVAYPDEARPYDWTRTSITLKRADGSVAVFDASTFELTGELGLKVDRRFLRGNALKRKPVRNALPTYEGTLEGEFIDGSIALYEAFLAGEVCSLTVDIEGLTPGTSTKVECPAVQFTGESPEAAVDELTVFNLPFRVLDSGVEDKPAIRVTYVEPTPDFVPAG